MVDSASEVGRGAGGPTFGCPNMTPIDLGHAGGIKFPTSLILLYCFPRGAGGEKVVLGFLLRLVLSATPRKHRLLETNHLACLLRDQE